METFWSFPNVCSPLISENMGKSLIFFSLSLLICKMGIIKKLPPRSVVKIKWARVCLMRFVQRATWMGAAGIAFQSMQQPNATVLIHECKASLWVTPGISLLSQPWSYLLSQISSGLYSPAQSDLFYFLHTFFITGSLSMRFQEGLLVSNIFWVWLFLKTVLSHYFRLLHSRLILSAKMGCRFILHIRTCIAVTGELWNKIHLVIKLSTFTIFAIVLLLFFFFYETVKIQGLSTYLHRLRMVNVTDRSKNTIKRIRLFHIPQNKKPQLWKLLVMWTGITVVNVFSRSSVKRGTTQIPGVWWCAPPSFTRPVLRRGLRLQRQKWYTRSSPSETLSCN